MPALLEVVAVLPRHPAGDPTLAHSPPAPTPARHRRCSQGWQGDCWLRSVCSVPLAMLGELRFSTLGRREQGPAHLCCLHLAGEPTFPFGTGGQTEGLQRTICVPVYITECWIVTSCGLILWIFFLKLNIFYCWTAGMKCRGSLCHLEKPHRP